MRRLNHARVGPTAPCGSAEFMIAYPHTASVDYRSFAGGYRPTRESCSQ